MNSTDDNIKEVNSDASENKQNNNFFSSFNNFFVLPEENKEKFVNEFQKQQKEFGSTLFLGRLFKNSTQVNLNDKSETLNNNNLPDKFKKDLAQDIQLNEKEELASESQLSDKIKSYFDFLGIRSELSWEQYNYCTGSTIMYGTFAVLCSHYFMSDSVKIDAKFARKSLKNKFVIGSSLLVGAAVGYITYSMCNSLNNNIYNYYKIKSSEELKDSI